MADNNDGFLDNFSIQNSFESGLGNTELLDNLLDTDSVTSSSEQLEPIIKEATTPKQVEPSTKGKELVQKEEGETLSSQDIISNFLGDDDTEEEEEEIVPVKNKEIENNEEEEEVSKFGALSKDLFKLGVFSKEEDEEDVSISTPEEFLERFNSEKKKGSIEMVNNFIGQFGEDYQQAFEAIFVNGADPKEYFNTYNSVVGFAELDLTQESNQEQVMKQALKNQGFDAEDITSEIERLKNYGDLESVAVKHHKVLVKKESQKLQDIEENSKRELQQKTNIRNQYINNVQSIIQEKLKTKEFDGIPLSPKLANDLQDFLLVDKYKTNSGETLTDFDKTILELKRPENHATKVKIGLLLKMLETDPTLSSIQKKGVTNKTNALFSEVAKQVTKDKTVTANKPGSWFL